MTYPSTNYPAFPPHQSIRGDGGNKTPSTVDTSIPGSSDYLDVNANRPPLKGDNLESVQKPKSPYVFKNLKNSNEYNYDYEDKYEIEKIEEILEDNSLITEEEYRKKKKEEKLNKIIKAGGINTDDLENIELIKIDEKFKDKQFLDIDYVIDVLEEVVENAPKNVETSIVYEDEKTGDLKEKKIVLEKYYLEDYFRNSIKSLIELSKKFDGKVFINSLVVLQDLEMISDSIRTKRNNVRLIIMRGNLIDIETLHFLSNVFDCGLLYIETTNKYTDNSENVSIMTFNENKYKNEEEADKAFETLMSILEIYSDIGEILYICFEARFSKLSLIMSNIFYSDFANNFQLILELVKFYNRKDLHGVFMIGINKTKYDVIKNLDVLLKSLVEEIDAVEYTKIPIISKISDNHIRTVFVIGIKKKDMLDYISLELANAVITDFNDKTTED